MLSHSHNRVPKQTSLSLVLATRLAFRWRFDEEGSPTDRDGRSISEKHIVWFYMIGVRSHVVTSRVRDCFCAALRLFLSTRNHILFRLTMAPSKIKISAGNASIAPSADSPQLMPFHIAHSGAAPITTFFRVRLGELKDASAGKPLPSSSPSSIEGQEVREGVATGERRSSSPKSTKRLVAAFRGRQVIGTEIPLPGGYAGVVLRSDTSNKNAHNGSANGANGTSKRNGTVNGKKGSTQGTRRSKHIEITDDDAEAYDSSLQEGMDIDDPYGLQEDVKMLRATQTFQSLLVWNADVAVDEGQDEYVRSLREWTTVAAEVRFHVALENTPLT